MAKANHPVNTEAPSKEEIEKAKEGLPHAGKVAGEGEGPAVAEGTVGTNVGVGEGASPTSTGQEMNPRNEDSGSRNEDSTGV